MAKRIVTSIFTAILCVLLCTNSYSQAAKLKGKVIDDATKEGLFGVNVMVARYKHRFRWQL